MAEKMMIVLGCDCDPDRQRYGGAGYDERRSLLKWRGIEEGIPLLLERLCRIESAVGIKVKIVFFLRSDTQIREIHGDAAWSILEHMDTWRRLESEGHELAWHPHIWRWGDERQCWYQETRDRDWIGECLESGHRAISEALGKNPASCHMGWTFHNDITMDLISRLGVKIDFSASPGVYSEGGPGAAGTTYDNMIDWVGTPQAWYRPSSVDYRRPARPGEDELDIIEAPKFTSGSRLIRQARKVFSLAAGARPSQLSTRAFIQVTAMPSIYGIMINEYFGQRPGTAEAGSLFATYFHLDELLPDRPVSARGLLYSPDNLEKNLIRLVRTARQKAADRAGGVEFVTGAQAHEFIINTVGGAQAR